MCSGFYRRRIATLRLLSRRESSDSSVHALHIHHAGLAALAVRRLRADAGDREVHVNLACFLEIQRAPDVLAFRQRPVQADEHDVLATGLELDGLTRLDLDAVG